MKVKIKSKRNMTPYQAKNKLRKLFPNRYQMVDWKLTTSSNGTSEKQCILYLDPKILIISDTFEGAFVKLERTDTNEPIT